MTGEDMKVQNHWAVQLTHSIIFVGGKRTGKVGATKSNPRQAKRYRES